MIDLLESSGAAVPERDVKVMRFRAPMLAAPAALLIVATASISVRAGTDSVDEIRTGAVAKAIAERGAATEAKGAGTDGRPRAERPTSDRCPADGGRLGVRRVVDIDAAAGPIFGEITRRAREPSFLKPKEVVLTFDDGPMPWITRSILDTLDSYCAKATFFEVGRMAVAYPGVVREVLARGHTIGGHTWSHPFNLPHMKPEKAQEEIEKGLAAVSLAAGQPVAPFFRFTGLGDSDPLLAYLQKRGIASFTVDVVSDDSYISDPAKLARVTLQRIEQHKGGIVLFHDIKAATAKALPVILAALSERGYTIVHMRSKQPLQALKDYDAALSPQVARALPHKGDKPPMLPFFGAVGPEHMPQVTELAPEPRARNASQPAKRVAMGPRQRQAMTRPSRGMQMAQPGAWATEVRPSSRPSSRGSYFPF